MRDFVQSMKQEHQYISGNHSEALMNAEAVIFELKNRNKELMDQLIQAEQHQAVSALQMANSREREGLREKNSVLENEIQRLRREMDDVEKTCKHMRDRFEQEQEASQYTSRDLQDKISQLERDKQHYASKCEQLQKNLEKKDSQVQDLQLGSEKLKRKVLELQSSVSLAGHRGLAQLVPFLTQLRSQIRHIGQEVDTARGIQVDLQRLFVSRMSSLKTLFRSEAEIAPRGTILQMMKLRDSQVSSMTAAEKVRRELKDEFSQRHRKFEEEFSDRLRRECHQRDQRIDEAEGVIEELRKELREGMHREKILRREAEETAQEHKKLVSSNDALAKSLERLASQKSSDDESINSFRWMIKCELLKQREDATQEIASLTVRLSDSEDQITELSAQLEVTVRELKQRKLQLKEVSNNKENLKSSDNTLIEPKAVKSQIPAAVD